MRGDRKRTAGINQEVLLERQDRMGAVPHTAEVGMGTFKLKKSLRYVLQA